jgi:uncharacterized MAPEG superfamily protein
MIIISVCVTILLLAILVTGAIVGVRLGKSTNNAGKRAEIDEKRRILTAQKEAWLKSW